jgi:hypothetical protein
MIVHDPQQPHDHAFPPRSAKVEFGRMGKDGFFDDVKI